MRSNEFITEKRRRNKGAIYGPGPFGGYGYATGYSGDGGSVGEASYEGNIGAMEVAKFFKVADDEQKKLLKELIAKNKKGLAWKLIQDVVGVRLKGVEFNGMYEGWRDWAAGAALGAAALGANAEIVKVMPGQTVYSIARAMGTTPEAIQKANKLDKNFTVQAGQELKIPDVKFRNIDAQPKTSKQKLQPSLKTSEIKKSKNIETKTGSPRETLLRKAAAAGGITDHVELAAFLAQATVETGRFGDLDEKGSRKRIERMYDPKYNPGGASAIGNTKIGDGWRYRGRGFLQLTGRYNYTAASRSLGLDLVRNPDLVLKPEIAATTAVWYWKWRVRPNVSDFHDTEKITALVQGKDKHLDRRQKAFRDFLQFQMAQI